MINRVPQAHYLTGFLLTALLLTGCDSRHVRSTSDSSEAVGWQEFAEHRRQEQQRSRTEQVQPLIRSGREIAMAPELSSVSPAETLKMLPPIPEAHGDTTRTSSPTVSPLAGPQLTTSIAPASAVTEVQTIAQDARLVRLPPVSSRESSTLAEDGTVSDGTVSQPTLGQANTITAPPSTRIPAPFFVDASASPMPEGSANTNASGATSISLSQTPGVVATPTGSTQSRGNVAPRPTHRFMDGDGWAEWMQPQERESSSDTTVAFSPEALASVRLSPSVAKRAEELMKQATQLAERGALYSARSEYLQVLRLVAQSLDSELGARYHSRALAQGLQALDEANDFAMRGGSAASDLQVSGYVAGHRTPVLKQANLDQYTPLMAMQAYYEFAATQLRRAGNRELVAARALYGLGRIDILLSHQSDQTYRGGPTPVVLFQAALAIDPRNADAANELGVLMARYGQLQQATRYLEQSLAARPTEIVANNLAEVRRRQGLPAPPVAHPASSSAADTLVASRVQWVDPDTFVRMSSTAPGSAPQVNAGPTTSVPTQQTAATSRGAFFGWGQSDAQDSDEHEANEASRGSWLFFR